MHYYAILILNIVLVLLLLLFLVHHVLLMPVQPLVTELVTEGVQGTDTGIRVSMMNALQKILVLRGSTLPQTMVVDICEKVCASTHLCVCVCY